MTKTLKLAKIFKQMSDADLNQQAVNQALAGNWQAAINCNQLILKKDPNDIDALCRLAKACLELGKKSLARRSYNKVLKLDSLNQIARKNLLKLNSGTGSGKKNKKTAPAVYPGLFVEEPGKTKVVSLIGLCSSETLLELSVGDPLRLVPKKRSLSIYDEANRFLGKIPDDLSHHLIKLIKKGNQYSAVVKSVDKKNLAVFIIEEKRGRRNLDIPSFPAPKHQYHSFIPASVLERAPIKEIEELEET